MDEPTGSVDPKTELAIHRELHQEFADEAVVSTLHRLHLFDHMYIMQDGKIVDESLLTELRQRSLVFQKMWAHQKEVKIRVLF